MLLNVSAPLLAITGVPLKTAEGPIATLKWAAVEALAFTPPDLPAMEKVARFKLAQKIYAAETEIELAIEEIAKIKELIGKYLSTIVTGAAYEIIEHSK